MLEKGILCRQDTTAQQRGWWHSLTASIRFANNLANVNTTGFKEDNLVVGDFMRLYKEARDELPNQNHTFEAAQFYNRAMTKAPQIVDAYTDHSVGVMQKTNNTLDFALARENLFFVVKTPQGLRLTRDGSFTTDDEGRLITKQGYEVLPRRLFYEQSNDSFYRARQHYRI